MTQSIRLYFILLLLMILIRVLGIETVGGMIPGILPGYPFGWMGILTSPFFHADYAHLFSNIIPLIVLGWIGFQISGRQLWFVLGGIWLLGGLGVYFFARPVWHIGASSWVYGLIAYLFFLGIFSRNQRSFLLSLAIAILYGGSVAGLFPTEARISWESHLYSAFAGIAMAWHFRKTHLPVNKDSELEDEEYNSEETSEKESPILYHSDWDDKV